MRIWQYDELMEGFKREGIDTTNYYWYTDQVSNFCNTECGSLVGSESALDTRGPEIDPRSQHILLWRICSLFGIAKMPFFPA